MNLSLEDFLLNPGPIFDVRSPAEFTQGHIPGSLSLPLFNNEERAKIGTCYKQNGHQLAVEMGLLIVESKVDALLNLAATQIPVPSNSAKILCWRGGMRSGFVARLLGLLGYQTATLQGGYKTYRRWALKLLETTLPPSKLCVIGGLTGSGKTEILHALRQLGEQVIDLEGLANHKGSAFGSIGLSGQPSQEQFENTLAWEINRLDWSRRVWIEDESRLIGRCHLPSALYKQMLDAPVIYVENDKHTRLQNIMKHYGQATAEQLCEAVNKISRRLGSQLTKEIILLFESNAYEEAFSRLLSYYDKAYEYQMSHRQTVHRLQDNNLTTPHEWACALHVFLKKLGTKDEGRGTSRT